MNQRNLDAITQILRPGGDLFGPEDVQSLEQSIVNLALRQAKIADAPVPMWLIQLRAKMSRPDVYRIAADQADMIAAKLAMYGAIMPDTLTDEEIDSLIGSGLDYNNFRLMLAQIARDG